jgi:hypothetical protein
MNRTLFALALSQILAACGHIEPLTVDEGVTDRLDPRGQLIRLSIDLRGVHPTEDELQSIEADPDSYASFVDAYLYDPRFLRQMEDLYNGVLRTRTGDPWFDPAMAGLSESDQDVAESVGSEPLKLISHVIDSDAPFSEIFLVDYTLADEIVAAMWGLDYPAGAEGWQALTYDDGRPMAGVLSSTSLWTRYPSAGLNANRHRANNLSRMFLCDDYLTRPVTFTQAQIEELSDGGDPNEVIANTASCQSCHSTLDPIAAHFFGFWWEADPEDAVAMTTYMPGDEGLYAGLTSGELGWFGRPTSGLRDLATALAVDERFYDCTVQTVVEGLTQRATSDADWTTMQHHKEAFVGANLNFRELVRSVVTSDSYLATEFEDSATHDRIPVVKTVSPRQLSDIVSDKTGFVLSYDGLDALKYNDMGLVVLDGGIDGQFVTDRTFEPTVSSMFVQERLAQAAGFRVATNDLNPQLQGDAILLRNVDVYSNPTEHRAAFEVQIRSLYLDLTGKPLPAEAPQIEELISLWKQIFSVTSSSTTSWAGVIAAVLRDPSILFY